jgi:hypothetical protein
MFLTIITGMVLQTEIKGKDILCQRTSIKGTSLRNKYIFQSLETDKYMCFIIYHVKMMLEHITI